MHGTADDTVCPRCYSSFSKNAESWNCVRCNATYPTCGDGLPVLVADDPQEAVARAYFWLQGQLSETEDSIRKLQSQRWENFRWDSNRTRILEALKHNSTFLSKMERRLRNSVSPSSLYHVAKDAVRRYEYLDFLSFLERDWSRLQHYEEQIRLIENAVALALERAGGSNDVAIVLGAGMGRFALGLTNKFQRVRAFDASVPMVLAFRLLTEEAFDYCYVQQSNTQLLKDQVRRVRFSMDDKEVQRARTETVFRYLVADANQLPVCTGSASAVISIFFSDVVPLHRLVKEVSRVLAPEGVFIHFGPLQYHFQELQRKLPLEEIRRAIQGWGFDLLHEQWSNTKHREFPECLFSYSYTNWCFAARKLPEGALSPDAVTRIANGTSISTEHKILDDGTTAFRASLLSRTGEQMDLSQDEARLLTLINGELPLKQVILTACDGSTLTQRKQYELMAFVSGLRRRGIIDVS